MDFSFDLITAWVLNLVDSPWVLLAVVLLATIDGFFPPVPSESVVIAVTVLVVAGESGISLWWLIGAAALGAFTGDLIAYHIGRALPIERMRLFQNDRGRAALRWAEHALERRATMLIFSARFIPVGRVAVNMAAGAIGSPRPRFMLLIAISGVVWGGYATLLGMAAGRYLHDHPVIGVVVGVTLGLLLGMVIDQLLARLNIWLERRADEGRLHTRVGEALKRGTEPADIPDVETRLKVRPDAAPTDRADQ